MRPQIATTAVDVPQSTLDACLSPYVEECRYLKKMTLEYRTPQEGLATTLAGDGTFVRGEFSIPQPFYIRDTGHFNAAEFIVCYNQIGYVFLSQMVERHLATPMQGLTLNDFFQHQLGGVLIRKAAMTFRAPINSRSFIGEVFVDEFIDKKDCWLLLTRCIFCQTPGSPARAKGEIQTVVLKPNARRTAESL